MKLPQLSLRDLFWLVLVATIFTVWGVDHQRAANRIDELTRLMPFSQQTPIHITAIPGGYFQDLKQWWPEAEVQK